MELTKEEMKKIVKWLNLFTMNSLSHEEIRMSVCDIEDDLPPILDKFKNYLNSGETK